MAPAAADAQPRAPGPGERAGSGTLGLGGVATVLRIRPFRRLWLVLSLSALGDWLGLLASAAFATAQVATPAAKGTVFGSVIAVQLLPALLLGPLAGVMADRFDRRHTMVFVDVLRFLLYASIPTVGLLVHRPVLVVGWAATALFLAQAAAIVWTPAKDAAVPNLLPRSRLETANQLTLATTYGVAPVLAALLFAAMARLPGLGGLRPSDVALYVDALTFLASAAVVLFGIRQISGHGGSGGAPVPGMWRDLVAGGRYVAATPLVRGLIVGVLGAFTGAGVVIGTAKFYAGSLGGGDATFGVLFAVLFAGFGIGIVAGPPAVGELSRRRWFGLSIVVGGAAVLALSAMPRLAGAAVAALLAGAGAGMALLSGITLLGGEVPDRLRGRVFAFIQTAVRVLLLLAISASGFLVGVGATRRLRIGPVALEVSTPRVLLAVAGLVGIGVGIVAYRQMDDRPGVPLRHDLWAVLRRRPPDAVAGLYLAVNGADPALVAATAGALATRLHGAGVAVLLAAPPEDAGTVRAALARGVVVIAGQTPRRPEPQRPAAIPAPRPDLTVLLGRRPQGAGLGTGAILALDGNDDPDDLAGRIADRALALLRAARRRARTPEPGGR